MIDYHTHILPNIDDGARSVDESLLMLEMLGAQGVKTVFATPHFYRSENSVDDFLERRAAAYNELISGMAEAKCMAEEAELSLKDSESAKDPKPAADEKLSAAVAKPASVAYPEVKLGAEVFYFEGISMLENASELEKLKLEGTNYLLLEMPFTKWTGRMISDIVALNDRNKLEVVIAHIDRYAGYVAKDVCWELKSHGVKFQANVECFQGFLEGIKSRSLLKKGFFDIFGSDCHNVVGRKPNMDILNKKI